MQEGANAYDRTLIPMPIFVYRALPTVPTGKDGVSTETPHELPGCCTVLGPAGVLSCQVALETGSVRMPLFAEWTAVAQIGLDLRVEQKALPAELVESLPNVWPLI